MIHQYRNNGYNIVLDVNSGAVHVVDELCYDVIAHLAAGEEPDEAALDRPETLEGLQEEVEKKAAHRRGRKEREEEP